MDFDLVTFAAMNLSSIHASRFLMSVFITLLSVTFGLPSLSFAGNTGASVNRGGVSGGGGDLGNTIELVYRNGDHDPSHILCPGKAEPILCPECKAMVSNLDESPTNQQRINLLLRAYCKLSQ